MVRPTVNSNKHYLQVSLATVDAATTTNTVLAVAVDAPSADSALEVRQGSVIKAVYVEMWVRSSGATPGTVLISFYKKPGVGTNMTFAEHVGLHTYDNKKNVFYHTQGLVNDNDADAVALVRGWFKVPKGKQRMGLNDALILAVTSQVVGIDLVQCGFATYKEYF